jgi:PAS domain S-box-containing protein
MSPASDTVRVLHVDDDPEFAETTAAFLEEANDRFDVETARSADEGLERLADRDVDCVVSDYDMPGRNGIEFLEAVRTDRPALPFVLFTGKGSEEVASDAISAGVTDYLHKQGGTSQYALLANRIANAVEQHRSRVALEESQRRLSLFIAQSPLGVIEYDEEFEIVRLNPAGEEILGYSEAELRGETWEALVTDRSYENVDRVTDALSEGTGGFHSVDENVRKDGEHIVCEWHNRVVTDETGEVVAVFSLFQDVTERKRRERELETMNRRLEAVLENTTTPMYMKDAEGRFRFVNRGFRELFGLEDEEIVDRTDHDLFPAELADEYRANDRTVLDRGEPVEAEERVTVDGDQRVFVSTKVPVYHTGERADPDDPVAVFGVSLDVTDRTDRERELRRYEVMVHTMQEAAAIYDTDGRFEFVNQYLADFYGTTREALVGEDSQLVPRVREEHGPEAYQQLLAGERDELRGELAADFSGVGYEVLEYRLAPLVIDGVVEGIVAVAHEVTEYKRRERTLRRRNEQLDRFASLVSHDLRTPLSVADGRVDLAMGECDSEHLLPAANALDRCEALVDDLLALARDGGDVRDFEVVGLASTVEACWDTAAMGDATLVVDTERSVRADRSRLRQLLENLFRNSVEHGSTGSRPGAGDSVEHGSTGPRSPTREDSVEHGGTTVTVGDLADGFYVADDGPGIPPEARDRVFEAGYSTATDGTGFGLAIVREVADAHGWQVAVTESEGGGARFEVTGVEFDPE